MITFGNSISKTAVLTASEHKENAPATAHKTPINFNRVKITSIADLFQVLLIKGRIAPAMMIAREIARAAVGRLVEIEVTN